MDPAQRIERLRQAIPGAGLDALWIHPGEDFRYLTGLNPIAMERLFGLVIRPDHPVRLVVPLLSAEECSTIPDCELLPWSDEEGPRSAAKKALQGIGRLGVSRHIPLWAYEEVRASSTSDLRMEETLVARMRERKDLDEIELLRRSAKTADGVVDWVGSLDLASSTEVDVSFAIRRRFMELGMDPGDEAIVASGPNAAMPHYAGGEIAIDLRAPLLLDIGAATEGYWSDITRVYLPEELEDDLSRAWDSVVDAYHAAFDRAGPGVPCEEVDRAARSVIEDAGLGESFIHRTGHGLGLEIHEPPYIRAGNDQVLEVGHVFTIEPGVYLPGRFGLRYENVVVVTEDGIESLNDAPTMNSLA